MRLRTLTRAAGIAAAATLAVPASAAAANTVYPTNANTFNGGLQGWSATGMSCGPVSGAPGSLCTTGADYDGATGSGSLRTSSAITVNLLGLFKGESTFTSPNFTVPSGAGAVSAKLSYDRSFAAPTVLALGPASAVEVALVDRTTGTIKVLTSESLTTATSALTTRTVPVAASSLTPGHTYAVKLDTSMTTSAAGLGVLGTLTTHYDNVRLDVATGDSTTSGGGESSSGVTSTGKSLSGTALTRLASSITYTAEVGRLSGGSVVPKARCTIVGTSKADRIVGTRGNDVICGLGGKDRIAGGGGNDIIDTGSGNDTASGGAGNDVIAGLAGKDRLSGQSGKDRLGGGRSGDRLNGGAGNDTLLGGTGNDAMAGSSGNDRLTGGSGGDRISGNSGKDRIAARDRHRDRVNGGSGRDRATVDRRARKGGARSRAKINRRADRVRLI